MDTIDLGPARQQLTEATSQARHRVLVWLLALHLPAWAALVHLTGGRIDAHADAAAPDARHQPREASGRARGVLIPGSTAWVPSPHGARP